MRIYYAHPMVMYGSIKELEDLKFIQKKYPEAEIINPSSIKPNDPNDSMGVYLRTVKTCDLLICRKIPNAPFTGGIGKEINHALENGIKVLEIKNKNFITIKKEVEFLSRKESNLLFDKMRSDKKYRKYRYI